MSKKQPTLAEILDQKAKSKRTPIQKDIKAAKKYYEVIPSPQIVDFLNKYNREKQDENDELEIRFKITPEAYLRLKEFISQLFNLQGGHTGFDAPTESRDVVEIMHGIGRTSYRRINNQSNLGLTIDQKKIEIDSVRDDMWNFKAAYSKEIQLIENDPDESVQADLEQMNNFKPTIIRKRIRYSVKTMSEKVSKYSDNPFLSQERGRSKYFGLEFALTVIDEKTLKREMRRIFVFMKLKLKGKLII
jgi:hypothetical protein